MINETMTNITTQITAPGIPPWIQILALFGILFIIQMVFKTGINLIYAGAYIYGFFKYLIDKWRKK